MGIAETMKAIADRQRRRILLLLKGGRRSAGEIASYVSDLSAATVSYHLSVLKKARLIREERQKNHIYYELNASVFEQLLLWVGQFTGEAHEEENL
ncbi:MAG: metalloregulator ArsR/SmtB family transcription factor [Sphaerochaeta sp.]|jgi:DNA-binding transcriptional ArsR family regulator|nr:metalloregulator ArsR/SmtB family transcription factor [Sphaerochaeta sp.]MDX9914606.1 metalloregulator ArsR/SmtB family transcription factor [Sphaerochaeta sp.]